MSQLTFNSFTPNTLADANAVNAEMTKIFDQINTGMESDNIAPLSISTGAIIDGAVTNAKLNTAAGELGGEWQDWAESFSGFTGGSLTVTSRYAQHGKTVKGKIVATLGGTPTGVTNFTFTLPVAAHATQNILNTAMSGSAIIKDATGGIFMGAIYFNSTTQAIVRLIDTSSSKATLSTPSLTVPMTWVVNDLISITFEYEAA